jgi:hypothetical protein
LFSDAFLNAFGNRSDPAFGNSVPFSFLAFDRGFDAALIAPLELRKVSIAHRRVGN